jgi:methyltransferase family protein
METLDPELRAAHLSESVRRLPGPPYYRVLNWIHRFLRPANYFEIGVHKGVSLHQALPETPHVIGIDPKPDIRADIANQPPTSTAQIYELTSDEFFANYDLRELLGGNVALAFIDGLHLFEQVLQDFVNVERYSARDAVVLLHDCLPFDAVTASRERTTDFYSGDVWKAILALRRRRPELDMITVRTAPTGLCLVGGLDREDRRLDEVLGEVVGSYRDLDFDYYLAHKDEMPDEIPNEVKAVGDWLRGRPGA